MIWVIPAIVDTMHYSSARVGYTWLVGDASVCCGFDCMLRQHWADSVIWVIPAIMDTMHS